MSVAKRFLLICAASFGLGSLLFAARPPKPRPTAPYKIERGELNGAPFIWYRPPNWNQRVLLWAHDQRPAASPLASNLSGLVPNLSGRRRVVVGRLRGAGRGGEGEGQDGRNGQGTTYTHGSSVGPRSGVVRTFMHLVDDSVTPTTSDHPVVDRDRDHEGDG